MNAFMNIIIALRSILWDYILIVGLVGLGIYLTVKLKFPQKRILPAFTQLIDDIKNKVEVPEGAMTPLQSLTTAIAAQVGTGNIVGVASAIAAGGPGAAFWMILSAFFGMASIFSEGILAQTYREKHNGELVGGPAYYIKNGLNNNILSKIFAIFCVLAMGIVGVMVQSNSVIISINDAFGLNPTIITVALVALVGMILVGGMGRIASFTEAIVPIMAAAYIIGSLIVIIVNIENLIPSIVLMFQGAFSPQAIGGGVLGITIREAISNGLARGLFSNEAGMGSTPHSHAVAYTKHPVEQGDMAMIGVFIATFVICMATIMVNMTSGSYEMTVPAAEMAPQAPLMTQKGFGTVFGRFGEMFVSISLTMFSLTTIVGWYFFAESNVKLLTNNSAIAPKIFKIISLAFLAFGGYVNADDMWNIADVFMGLMALPNIIALFLLSNRTRRVLDDYESQLQSQQELHWEFEFESEEVGGEVV